MPANGRRDLIRRLKVNAVGRASPFRFDNSFHPVVLAIMLSAFSLRFYFYKFVAARGSLKRWKQLIIS